MLTYLVYFYMKATYPDKLSGKPSLYINEDGRNEFLDTPSMNVSLATALTDTPEDEQSSRVKAERSTSVASPQPSSTSLSTTPVTASTPDQPKAARASSFIDKFKFRRTMSIKSAEEVTPSKPISEEELINLDETPWITHDPSMPLIISTEASLGLYTDVQRTTVGAIKEIPTWIHDWIVGKQAPIKDAAKLSFVLFKHPNSNLKEMPQEYCLLISTNRLSANRMLRIKKVIQYLGEKCGFAIDGRCCGCIGQGVYIELYCNGKVYLTN